MKRNEIDEADFQYLRALFPNRDDEAGSRLTYCTVLREAPTPSRQ
jgi:hypothetical protein